jgi:hypothetical protein
MPPYQRFSLFSLLLLTFSNSYASDKQQRLAQCEAIPWSDHQSWMIFNPSDLQTVYRRSQCLQRLAREERDSTLCAKVRERKALLLDGSGISPERCQRLVAEQITKDITAAQQLDTLHQLKQVRFVRNGNGRDIDIHIVTSGNAYNRYRLTIELNDSHGTVIGRIYNDIQMVGQGSNQFVLFLPQQELHKHVALHGTDKEFEVVMMLQPELDHHNRFVLKHTAEEGKRSTLNTVVNFSTLKRLPNW